MEITYLGSGIWSYSCWGEELVQILYNIWLRTNLSFQLKEGFMSVYWSTDRLVIILLVFTQIYCSHTCAHKHLRERERDWLSLLECRKPGFPFIFLSISQICIITRLYSSSYQRSHTFPPLTLRRAGAILLVRVPATIMTSACRGLALNTTPKRSMS